MVRKKKKREDELPPWCYYCDRIFGDETTLVQHQKAKHFKCTTCHKKLSSASGLRVHCHQVHRFTLNKVPAAKAGRDSIELEVFGMAGVPEGAVPGALPLDDDEPAAKLPKTEGTAPPPLPSPPQLAQPPPLVPPLVPPLQAPYGLPPPIRPPMPMQPAGFPFVQPVPGQHPGLPRPMPPGLPLPIAYPGAPPPGWIAPPMPFAPSGPAPFTGMAPPATQQLFPIGSGPPAQAADGQLPPPVTFPAAVPHVVTPRPEPLFPIAAAADGAAPMPQPPIPAGNGGPVSEGNAAAAAPQQATPPPGDAVTPSQGSAVNGVVWQSEDVSMEEKRALQPKYLARMGRMAGNYAAH